MTAEKATASLPTATLPELSFEFFPPQDDVSLDRLVSGTFQKLSPFDPQYCSVTYGAGGSTKSGTVQTIQRLTEQGVDAMPHLSVGGDDEGDLMELVERYRAQGIKRLLCLRGDQPSGTSARPTYARDLVSLLRNTFGDAFQICVAAYPEVHPDSANVAKDLFHFQEKVRAGADTAITQYFYCAEAYAFFLDGCASQGLDIPITPGIMPITNYSALVRFSKKAGADIPRWLDKQLSQREQDSPDLVSFGIEVVSKLCERLIALGAPGLHFYTLNRWGASTRICQNLGYANH